MEEFNFNDYCKLSDDGLEKTKNEIKREKVMTYKEDKMFSNIIERDIRFLSNGFKNYKEKTQQAKLSLIDTIIPLVNEIATLSHCAGMIYKRGDYEVYINTIEELKKMLYEKLEEL